MVDLAGGLAVGADDRARLTIPGSSGVSVDGLHRWNPVRVAGGCLLSYTSSYVPGVKWLRERIEF